MFICEHCGKELHFRNPSKLPINSHIKEIFRYLDIEDPERESQLTKLYWKFQEFVGDYNQYEHDKAVASLECLRCEMVCI